MDNIEQWSIGKSKTSNFIASSHVPCWITGIIFVILKLTDSIDWSWWWITSPLWGYYIALPIIVLVFHILRRLFIVMRFLVSTGILKALFKFVFSKILNKFTKNKKHNSIQNYDIDIDVTPLNENMGKINTIAFTNETIKPKRKRKKKKKRIK